MALRAQVSCNNNLNDLSLEATVDLDNLALPGGCGCNTLDMKILNNATTSQDVDLQVRFRATVFDVCSLCPDCVETTENTSTGPFTEITRTLTLASFETKTVSLGLLMLGLDFGDPPFGVQEIEISLDATNGFCQDVLLVNSTMHQLTGGTESNPEPMEGYMGDLTFQFSYPLRPECEACLQVLPGEDCSSAGTQAVKIDGFVNLSSNYCFRGASPQIRGTLYLGDKAGIILEEGASLLLDYVDVIPCAEMWSYILVKSGASLVVNEATITGGEYAIIVEDGGRLSVKNSTFTDNYVGVYFPGDTQGEGVELAGFQGNEFRTTGVALRPPHADKTRGFAGVWANYQPGLSLIGVQTPSFTRPNYYHHLANGLVLTNSSAIVQASTFEHITALPSENHPFSGRAISHVSTLATQGFGSLEVEGWGWSTAAFDDCTVGVLSVGGLVNIHQNLMTDVEIGVSLRRIGYADVHENRIFYGQKYGLVASDNAFGRVKIYDNEFYLDQPGPVLDAIGLRLEEPPLGIPNYYQVYNNYFYLKNAAEAIRLNGGAYVDLVNNEADMSENVENAGIVLAGSIQPNVACNELYGLFGSGGIGNNSVGIFSAMVDAPQLRCNQTSELYYGIQFLGMNNGTQTLGNDFNEHYVGLVLGVDYPGNQNDLPASIGLQPHRGNRWLAAPVGAGGLNALLVEPSGFGAVQNQFLVDEDENPLFGAINNADLFDWFKDEDLPGSTPTCASENVCPNGLGYVPAIKHPDGLDEAIAAGDSLHPVFQKGLLWAGRKGLYRRYQAGLLYSGQSDVDVFVQAAGAGELTGRLYDLEEGVRAAYAPGGEVDSLLGQRLGHTRDTLRMLAALDSLAAVDSLTDYSATRATYFQSLRATYADLVDLAATRHDRLLDAADSLKLAAAGFSADTVSAAENERIFWLVYLARLGADSLSVSQVSDLTDIATQCPLVGGPAVYHARALLAAYQPELTYDDSTQCAPPPAPRVGVQPGTAPAPMVAAWPNPVGDALRVRVTEQVTAVQAYDALGRTVQVSWDIEGDGISVATATLPTGIYWLALQSAGGARVATIRFVKQ